MTTSIPIRTAQVLGLTGTAFLSGLITTFSLIAVPGIASTLPSKPSSGPEAHGNQKPSHPWTAARQWQHMYLRGKYLVPPFALACSATFGSLALRLWPRSETVSGHSLVLLAPGYLYAAAALLVPGIVPFTLGVMMPTNDALEGIVAQGPGAARADEVGELMQKWKVLNYTRASMVAVAAMLGGLAMAQTM
ncbi:hypothetical protein MBLNU230_g8435t1 [Neophaeotheca triangularis]